MKRVSESSVIEQASALGLRRELMGTTAEASLLLNAYTKGWQWAVDAVIKMKKEAA